MPPSPPRRRCFCPLHPGPHSQANFQINENKLYTGGRHFIGLGHSFIVFPKTLQTVRMGTFASGEAVDGETLTTSSLLARTEDGLQVTLDLSFQYRLKESINDIIDLYRDFQDNYQPAYVRIARNVLRDVASEFQAFQYFYNHSVVGTRMGEVLNEALANHSASVQSFQLLCRAADALLVGHRGDRGRAAGDRERAVPAGRRAHGGQHARRGGAARRRDHPAAGQRDRALDDAAGRGRRDQHAAPDVR